MSSHHEIDRPAPRRGRVGAALATALLLVVAACSGDEAGVTTSSTSSTTMASTTTVPPTTSGPTSSVVYHEIELTLDGDTGARITVGDLYGWIADPTRPTPDIPPGLAVHLAGAEVTGSDSIQATLHSADVGSGRAGVVTAGKDVVLLADEGSGWRVVGAWLPRFGLDPWFGEPLRYVLVVGTDARPGQDQLNFRADSIHILTSNIAEGSGGILGFPRDAYVEAPYGFDKFTHVNVYSGQEAMVDIASDLSGLPIEGWLVTGFVGFQRLIDAFGGVWVDVPFAMNDDKAKAYLSAGYQKLWGANALGFSRNRHISGGDFTRSFHQGVVILAGLDGVLERDITELPGLLAMLQEHAWTDLPLGDLMTLAAGAFLLDPAMVGNRVLPGTVTSRGGASVVVLSPGAEDLFRDLDDGSLSPSG